MRRLQSTRRTFVSTLVALGAAIGLAAEARSRSDGKPERILVIGAGGRLGSLIVGDLASAGAVVRALVRAGHTPGRTLPPAVEIANGDLRDRDELRAALQGVDRIVFAASASGGGAAGNTPQAVDYGGVVNVLAVAPSTLRQFVLVSSSAVTQPLHPHNMWSDILLWKLKGEQALRASGVPYTVVRPTGMRDYPGGTEGVGFAQGDVFAFGYVISRDDAASVCVAALATDAALHKTLEAYNEPTIAPGALEGKFAALKDDVA